MFYYSHDKTDTEVKVIIKLEIIKEKETGLPFCFPVYYLQFLKYSHPALGFLVSKANTVLILKFSQRLQLK